MEPDDAERRITQSARSQHPRHRTIGSSRLSSVYLRSCNASSHQHEHRRRTLSSRMSSSSSSASSFLGFLAHLRTGLRRGLSFHSRVDPCLASLVISANVRVL